ncbi:MAG TPA: hypothetical protein ENH86_02780 [Candidatus Jorgensenbacteria bacterium]|nr:hypothetical protein [Candidatus Jorgensenbacteria bacterium]
MVEQKPISPQQQVRQRAPAQAKPQLPVASITIGLPWRLMVFSFVLFLFSIFIFAGLQYGYGTYLDAQTVEVDENIAALAQQVSESEQEELLLFYSQLTNLQKVLDRRVFTVNTFPFLEKNTLPLVYYTEAQYTAEEGVVILNGVANSMQVFVQQITLFEESPEVERVIIDDVGLERGTVSFGLHIAFQSEFLKRLQQ